MAANPKTISYIKAAENIMKTFSDPVKREPARSNSPVVDVKQVTLDDTLVNSLIRESVKLVKKPVVEEKVEVIEESESMNEEVLLENKISSLVSRLTDLLKEARTVMAEITTVGSIGTNQKFVLNKKTKPNGSNKAVKRN